MIEHPQRVEALREQLAHHRIYDTINTPTRLALFMAHHVFAVWDFMTLLTALQHHFTTTTLPWTPPSCHPSITRLVNEIVVGEESDHDGHGSYCSHFELYVRAMAEADAPTTQVHRFLAELDSGWSVRSALAIAKVPIACEAFVRETMLVVDQDDPLAIAATFAYGREQIIPEMFSAFLAAGHELPPTFRYYLERHVEIDGGEHADSAHAVVGLLLGESPMAAAVVELAATASLEARLAFWDDVADAIERIT